MVGSGHCIAAYSGEIVEAAKRANLATIGTASGGIEPRGVRRTMGSTNKACAADMGSRTWNCFDDASLVRGSLISVSASGMWKPSRTPSVTRPMSTQTSKRPDCSGTTPHSENAPGPSQTLTCAYAPATEVDFSRLLFFPMRTTGARSMRFARWLEGSRWALLAASQRWYDTDTITKLALLRRQEEDGRRLAKAYRTWCSGLRSPYWG